MKNLVEKSKVLEILADLYWVEGLKAYKKELDAVYDRINNLPPDYVELVNLSKRE